MYVVQSIQFLRWRSKLPLNHRWNASHSCTPSISATVQWDVCARPCVKHAESHTACGGAATSPCSGGAALRAVVVLAAAISGAILDSITFPYASTPLSFLLDMCGMCSSCQVSKRLCNANTGVWMYREKYSGKMQTSAGPPLATTSLTHAW